MTQADLVMEYFKKNPNRDIRHEEIVPWLIEKWGKRTGNPFRDPDWAIRKWHQQGFLIKVRKGVYRYDPDKTQQKELKPFTQKQKAVIFKRDDY